MSGDVAGGTRYLIRGARMLGHPSLRLFVIVPLTVNIVIFGTLLTIGFGYVTELMDWLLGKLPGWL
ncbi:MAG: sulfate transporter CysZ, partial [Halioglobus sp.]|nr:sulfate transporter CysZ [Halioglobus sp.]